MKKDSKNNLFLELANPDNEGISRWVNISEFKNQYVKLSHGNGRDWGRNDDPKFKYVLDLEKKGNKIISYKCVGLKRALSKYIRPDIVELIRNKKCLLLGTSKPEVDHKNGRNNNPRVAGKKTQKISDFQPLSKAANDAKRQFCKDCKKTNKRYDAKKLGYEKSFTNGNINYVSSIDGCVGCFWYDISNFQIKVKVI